MEWTDRMKWSGKKEWGKGKERRVERWKGEEELMKKGGKRKQKGGEGESGRVEFREEKGGGVKRVQWVRVTIDVAQESTGVRDQHQVKRQKSIKRLHLTRSACLIKGSHRSELWASQGLSGKFICKLTRPPYYRYEFYLQPRSPKL